MRSEEAGGKWSRVMRKRDAEEEGSALSVWTGRTRTPQVIIIMINNDDDPNDDDDDFDDDEDDDNDDDDD